MPRTIVIILTIIAVMASFFLTTGESLQAASRMAEWQSGLSGKVHCNFPEQTGDPASFTNSDDTRFSLFRTDAQRFYTFLGDMNGLGHLYCLFGFGINSKNNLAGIKDTIFLNLRI